MLIHRVLSRVLPQVMVILTLTLIQSVAAAAGQPTHLAPWQEQSVLAALQDPAASVRYAAISWLSDKQVSNEALVKAIAAYLHRDVPPSIKASAVQALGNLGPATLAWAPDLASLLGDSHEAVGDAAGLVLIHLGSRAGAVAPQVAELLRDPSSRVRATAAETLGALGPAAQAFIPRIVTLLKDPVVGPRMGAAEALDDMGPAAAGVAGQLFPLLGDGLDEVRSIAAQALCHIGPAADALVPRVLAHLHDARPPTRAAVAQDLGALACLGPPVTALAPQIAGLLGDPDPQVRAAAAEALGHIGSQAPQVIPRLAALLSDPAPQVRASAAQALGHIGPAAAALMPRIVALLTDPSRDVDFAAQSALGQMGPPAAAAVAALLKDANPDIRTKASFALEGMGSAAATVAPAIAALLKDPDPGIRSSAANTLGYIGKAAAAAVPQLAALLRDPEPGVRSVTLQALQQMRSAAAAAVPQLAALLKDPDSSTRAGAAAALGSIGPAAASVAPRIALLLKDPDYNARLQAANALTGLGPGASAAAPLIAPELQDAGANFRTYAAQALGSIGPAAAPFAPRIAALLTDADSGTRDAALQALDSIARAGPLQARSIMLYCLKASHASRSEAARFLLRAYLYRKLDPQDLILARWLGNRDRAEQPDLASVRREGAYAALQVFNSTWDETEHFPQLRDDMARSIAAVAGAQPWGMQQMPLLVSLHMRLASGFPAQALTVQAVLEKNGAEQLLAAGWVILTHFWAWMLLIFAYPRWRWVQGFFFWNRWARRFLGLFYVGLLITVVPPLRRRMLSPFRESFLPRRVLEQLNERAYFPDSEVLLEKNGRTDPRRLPLKEVLPSIRGQVVIKGQSGLGKTLLLLRLALASREPAVFLRATECSAGVVHAIQKKVHGQLRDERYLRSLIHAGALKVLIDGLNEASPDARTRITQFVEEYFKGDFILTTQPISWEPPSTARVYVLQPLLPGQIEPFLVQQWASVEDRATLTQAQYEQALRQYLANIEKDSQASARDPRLVSLSNPMDASLAAELLARGEAPDPLRLVEQRYEVMARAFREREGRDFRLQPFSERVYEWRKSGQPDIDTTGFEAEVAALVKDRLMIERTELVRTETGEQEVSRWFFRHDRIMELFLLPAFMGAHSARRQEHQMDEQFWGVYELLAARLPDEEEKQLRRFLVEQAADTNRNDLLNRYTLARRFRPPAPARRLAPTPSAA